MSRETSRELDTLAHTVVAVEETLFREKRGTLYKTIVGAIEKPLIEHTLERTFGNQLKAAKILGINRNTIRAKIRRLAIDVSRWKY